MSKKNAKVDAWKKPLLKIIDNMRKVVSGGDYKKVNLIFEEAISGAGKYDKYEIIINNIANHVIKDFNLQGIKTNLCKSNLRGDSILAREMCFVVIQKHLCLTPRKMAPYFHPVSTDTIKFCLIKYKKLDKDNVIDKKVIERIERLYKETIKIVDK